MSSSFFKVDAANSSYLDTPLLAGQRVGWKGRADHWRRLRHWLQYWLAGITPRCLPSLPLLSRTTPCTCSLALSHCPASLSFLTACGHSVVCTALRGSWSWAVVNTCSKKRYLHQAHCSTVPYSTAVSIHYALCKVQHSTAVSIHCALTPASSQQPHPADTQQTLSTITAVTVLAIG